jgi:hypothetical protein
VLTGFARGALLVFRPDIYLQMVALESSVQLASELVLTGQVEDKLGGFKSYGFDRSAGDRDVSLNCHATRSLGRGSRRAYRLLHAKERYSCLGRRESRSD